MKVLIHTCCAPCTIYPLTTLRKEGHEVRGYFYNPNIHPFTEFTRRRDALAMLADMSRFPVIFDEGYDLEDFLAGALERGKDRCSFCYHIRLDRTFRKALEERSDAVTTTLLYSKYQKHEQIVVVAEELAAKYSMPFLYKDFREGWKEGQAEARRLNLYRQNYCGCIFSEAERHKGKF